MTEKVEMTAEERQEFEAFKAEKEKNRQLTSEADFWKAMALMKVGATIKIPQRKFLGKSPEVEAAVREIIEENLTEYINNIDFNIR